MQVRGRAQVQNGWSFPLYGLGDFAQDYTYRAAVAIGGLGALPRLEAIYLRAAGADGRGFDSSKSWELTFAGDQLPPVDSFWSLSMYRQTADGQLFFTDKIGAGCFRFFGLRALGEHNDSLLLTDAVRQNDRAAHDLLGLRVVDAQSDRDLDRLVELRAVESLDRFHRIRHRQRIFGLALLGEGSISFGLLWHF